MRSPDQTYHIGAYSPTDIQEKRSHAAVGHAVVRPRPSILLPTLKNSLICDRNLDIAC